MVWNVYCLYSDLCVFVFAITSNSWKKRDSRFFVDEFIQWLEGLSGGDLYDKIAPYSNKKSHSITFDLEGEKNLFVAIFRKWNEEYFKTVSPSILEGLKEDCLLKEKKADLKDPGKYVELVSKGLVLEKLDPETKVILVPNYHYRPIATSCYHKEVIFIQYPTTLVENENKTNIIQLTKALSDDNRLEILKLLSKEKCNFTQIVNEIGSTKGNIHYHLLTLRAAGLVRVHIEGDNPYLYSLREDFTHELKKLLDHFFTYQTFSINGKRQLP